jgi:glycine betaine catabolism A
MTVLDAVLDAAKSHDGSRMLPSDAYTSADVYAWEQRHVFAGSWCCLGRVDEIRTGPVGQQAVAVGDVSVLLTWSEDGLRAFANTCRHRGHELMPNGESSTRRSVVCPYHAWSYALDGSLRAAPDFREVEDFDRAEHGLVELAVVTWHGWLFCHAANPLGAEVPAFDAHLGVVEDILGPYAPERLVRRARHTYEIAANWKVVCENYHECYHCPLIHPELCQVSPPSSGENYVLPGAWVGGRMDLRDGMATMSMTGEAAGPPIPGVDPRVVEYIQIWPNLLVSAHPDYVMTHRLVPQAPDRTWIECSWYFVDDADEAAANAVEFWDLTNRQDWSACESVQRGLGSPHFRPGPFAPSEDAVQQFVAMVASTYAAR